MPGNVTVSEIDWLAVWNEDTQENYGSVLIPNGLNIPPSLTTVHKFVPKLPNCEQLHRRLRVNWEIFGPQITFEIEAQIDENDYVAFGISGSKNSSKMIGSDVIITYMDGLLGYAVDYNVTDIYPCTNVLGLYKGVCPDTKVGAVDNVQIHTYNRENGITRLVMRRNLDTGDEGDTIIEKKGVTYLVWAIGKYNKFKEPRLHHIYPKGDMKVDFGRKASVSSCFDFVDNNEQYMQQKQKPWGPLRIFNQSSTTFYARLGVPADSRGYLG
ncbi:Skeletor: isoforms D/E-like protein 1, partial [Leptotrombidium deliense]